MRAHRSGEPVGLTARLEELVMSESIFEPSAELAKNAHIDNDGYEALYAESLADPDAFWAEQGKRIDWIKPYSQISDVSYDAKDLHIRWYADGTLNASANCLDRHLATRGEQTAIIWEGDDPNDHKHITYRELHEEVCKFSNVLKANGAKKGDRITIYMPMIPEATVAMLACTRIGAVHSVVFGGFSPDALAGRIQDCESTMIITADEGVRGGKAVPLKQNTDAALANCPDCTKAIVVRRTGADVNWVEGRDVWYHEAMASASADCPPEEINAEDPMFILYTSGSTGKPKGVLHTTGGYMVYASMTHKYVFDYHDGDIYWCTADVGWITGHSYIVYGPMANGATQVMYEGVPNFPGNDRFWSIVEKYKVTIFYTAPTAIRTFMKWGIEEPAKHDLSSLRLLGSVGEPINPEAWMWYRDNIGAGTCPVVDTWWQTETGGIMISPLPGATTLKPGSATFALPGVSAEVVDDGGQRIDHGGGYLTLTRPWPGMLRGIWGDGERYRETYWSRFSDRYFAGDGAKLDADGYLWLLGRVDDVMNVSGHRISTTEVESALVSHPSVAEAAVVGANDPTTGQAIIAYVTLRGGSQVDEGDLRNHVAKEIGAIAKPKTIYFTPDLPKTRSGKIMRRLLRDVAEGRNLGDTTTLADASVVDELQRRAADSPSED